jgi:FlaG/FlaF family flagellin (archaellin)
VSPARRFPVRRLRQDDRAVSTTVSYVLNIAVATILMSTLLITGTGLIDDQRERTVRTELRVVGNQLADGVATVDRLANANRTQSAVIGRDLPRKVAGETYTIAVHGGSDPYLLLSTSNPDIEISVNLTSLTDASGDPRTTLVDAAVSGGNLRLVYNATVDGCEATDPPETEIDVCDG